MNVFDDARPAMRIHRQFGSLLALFSVPLMLFLAQSAAAQSAPGDSAAAAQSAPAAPAESPSVAPGSPAAATPSAPAPSAAAPPAAAAPAPSAAAPGAPVEAEADTTAPDGGWPRAIQTPTGGIIILYQPQVLSWEGQKRLVAMSAVSYLPKGASKPGLGTVRLESPTSTSVEERMVNFEKVEVTSMNFPSLERGQTKEVLDEIRKSLPKENVLVSLDRILVAVDTTQLGVKGVKVNTEPPPIFFSKKPAILVGFDDAPIWNPISGTSLSYAVNTNWDVFVDNDTKINYLRNDTYWLQTKDFKKWEPIKKLPPNFDKLVEGNDWSDIKPYIPAKKMKGSMPVIFVSHKPAELILLAGSPKYEKVEGTELYWVSNTESDLFATKKKKEHYVLLSGRWFKTAKLDKGPWTFATTDLPPDFAKIPKGHERARVLSSVPGTEEASTAILLAQVPRTARVERKGIQAPDVKYDGEPKFAAIEGTKVSYAENSGFDVLKTGDSYYLCYQGVWFISKAPAGPWQLTTSIPEAIYAIPPESPAHHVTYVTVVDDDEENPTYGYTAGYVGVTIAFGCAMWGTGWYYPPYHHYPGYGAPIYYPRPVAYGGGAAYNPWTGNFGSYQAAYGPYGGVARASAYNPSTGTYARGAMAWGPTGAQGYASAYNPRTGTYAGTRQGSNVYGSWGSSHVQRGDDWVKSQRVTDAQGNTKWKAQGSGGGAAAGYRGEQGSGFVGKKGDDVYAGRDGNVYRKTDGGWQKYDQGGGWSDVNRPPQASNQPARGDGAGERPSQQPSTQPSQRPSGGDTGQLDREARARSEGNQRTRDYGNYQRSGGSSSKGGGYRGGGGSRGGRGGGGGRRR
jgi:hypothetical protein